MLRQLLFEYVLQLRYAVDWKSYNQQLFKSAMDTAIEYRNCGGSKGAMIDLTTPTVPEPLPLPNSVDVDPMDKQRTIDALEWATGMRDLDMLNVLHASLPGTVLREQEHKYKESIDLRDGGARKVRHIGLCSGTVRVDAVGCHTKNV